MSSLQKRFYEIDPMFKSKFLYIFVFFRCGMEAYFTS